MRFAAGRRLVVSLFAASALVVFGAASASVSKQAFASGQRMSSGRSPAAAGSWGRGNEAVVPANACAWPQCEGADPLVGVYSVSCPSAGSCGAVGGYNDSSDRQWGLLLTERDGRWLPGVKAGLPANANPTKPDVFLTSVSCSSVGNCSAVGSYEDSSGNTQGLLLTERDGKWSTGVEAKLPIDARTTNQVVYLTSVSCPSPGDCTAVGEYYDTPQLGTKGLLLTETAGTWLTGEAATLPADATTTPQSTRLASVSCAAAGNCAAVGSYSTSTAGGGTGSGGLMLTETAGSWAPGVEVVLPADSTNHRTQLNSVSCAATGDCSAVGSYYDSSGNPQGLLVNKRDGTWSPGAEAALPANANPKTPFVELNSVSCASAGNCSAGGDYYDNSNIPQALLINETAGNWETGVEALPAEHFVDPNIQGPPTINSVSCPSAGNCSAVATYFGKQGNQVGLLLTETAGRWATGTVPSQPVNAWRFEPIAQVGSISCASAKHCSAVGSYVYGGTSCPYCGTGGLLVGGSPATIKLRVSKSGTGAGRISSAPRRIGCGPTCSASFHSGTRLTLTARASTDSRFSGWSGGGCHGLGSCHVNTGISRQTVRATFVLLPKCVMPKLKGNTLTAAEDAIRSHNCTWARSRTPAPRRPGKDA